MEAFYAKINQLFTSVTNKNEAIIADVEQVKEQCTQMLEKLTIQNDAVIDEVQLFQQSATKEFKQICADLVPKATLGSLEQRANTAEQTVTQLRTDQTRYLKQIEDLEFEVKNLKSVSLLSQKDKYNRTLQIEIESLERKLKSAEAKYKALEDRITASGTQQPSFTPTADAVEPSADAVEPSADAVEPSADAVEPSAMTRCYARIGADKISPDSLTPADVATYPSDVYKSKTGKYLGKPCPNLVSASGDVFCSEHSSGFSDIRAEPPSDGEKPKKKKKAAAATASDSVATQEQPVAVESTANTVEATANTVVEATANTVVEATANAVVEATANAVVEATANAVELMKEKKTRKKKVGAAAEETPATTEQTGTTSEPSQDPVTPAPVEEKVKKPRKKKTDTVVTDPDATAAPTAATAAPTDADATPGSQSSTPGAKRGRKKKETPPTPTRTPITQKEYTLRKVEGVTRVNKPDWAFIVPWDGPDGKQYVIDDKTNYVFEATETGEIGAWTGFMRV